MKHIYGLLATIAAATASAAPSNINLPTSTTEGQYGYQTERLAAEAALKDVEGPTEAAGGIILEGDGLYYPTKAVSTEQPEHFAVRLLFKGKLVAIYHTHPGTDGTTASRYSDNDKAVAASLKVNSYIKVVATDSLYVLKTNGSVAQLSGPENCHGMKCETYYDLMKHKYAVALGQEVGTRLPAKAK